MTFRSASGNNSSSTTSLVVTAPSGIQNNDYMLAVLSQSTANNVSPNSIPSGWNEIGTVVVSGSSTTGVRLQVWYKRANNESGNYTWGWASASRVTISIGVWSDIFLTGDGQDATSTSSNAGGVASTTATTASITTVTAGALLVCLFGARGDTGFSQPTDMVERREDISAGNNQESAIDDETRVSAGATGTRASTIENVQWCTRTIALKPAAIDTVEGWGVLI